MKAHPPVFDLSPQVYSRQDRDLVKKARSTEASRARVLDRLSAKRVGDLWTRIHHKTSSYMAVVVYRQSVQAPRKTSAQLGLYTLATTLEKVVLKP